MMKNKLETFVDAYLEDNDNSIEDLLDYFDITVYDAFDLLFEEGLVDEGLIDDYLSGQY